MLETQYRVWPDGTVQDCQEEPYSWMSDDYALVYADDEDEAHLAVLAGTVEMRNRLHDLEAKLGASESRIADLEQVLTSLKRAYLNA